MRACLRMRRAARALAVLATGIAVGLLSACSDASDYIGQPGEGEEGDEVSREDQFDQLMQRPDIEEAVQGYEEMLAEIRGELRELTDLPEWERRERRGSSPGCARGFPELGVWDVETRSIDSWLSRDHFSEEEWPDVRAALHRIAGEYGFDSVVQDIDHGGARSYKLADDYGAQLRLGTEGYTTVGVTTGCHLQPGAKEHGQPRPRPDDLGGS